MTIFSPGPSALGSQAPPDSADEGKPPTNVTGKPVGFKKSVMRIVAANIRWTLEYFLM